MADKKVRCNAKAKGSGKQCRQNAIAPTTKCRWHGGLSLRGMASPRWKHGRHSKYLPRHLLSDYQNAVNDPELLSLREQIALLESREQELVRKLPRSWKELRAVLQERAKLVEAENRRLRDIGGFVSLERLMMICVGLLQVVKDNVPDLNARNAIQTRYNQLLDFQPAETNGEQVQAD